MRLKTNFWIDLVILAFFLVGFEPTLTGGFLHEWLNLTFAAVMLIHLLLHWSWIRGVVRRSWKTMSRSSGVSLYLNVLLFIAFVIMILSGLMISKNVLASSGAATLPHPAWHGLHETLGNVLLVLISLHFALHWKWIANTFTRLLVTPFRTIEASEQTVEGSVPCE